MWPLCLVLSAGMLSGSGFVWAPLPLSLRPASPLTRLSPLLLWILITAPPAHLWPFEEDTVSHSRYPFPRHIDRLPIPHTKLMSWSVQRLKNMCGLHWQKAPTGLQGCWRKTMTMKASANWGERVKDAWTNIWWTAVKLLSKLCLRPVAIFPPSVSVFNELPLPLVYVLTHRRLMLKLMGVGPKFQSKIATTAWV